ncbi:MAG: glycoside hydrolase family 5 protein [Treponema sp.]|jgi:endoglucanase|nr:glycoside hydrolase family 5 protein [Treponema sp.]
MHKKNYLFFICLIFILLLTVCKSNKDNIPTVDELVRIPDSVRGNELEPISGKTAFDYFRDERIFSGWNLGNSLDSYSDGLGGETTWGNASINQEIMNGVKAAGFDIIRIPVTWMGHIGNAPSHRVAAYRLKRVAEVAEMAHNAGLKVIINIHHDGSTPSQGRDDGWLSISKAYKNARENERITLQFARVWEQIAVYFQNYGDWLMFEAMNEIHDGGWAYSTEFKMFPNQQLDVLNKWNQTFLDRVRLTGGNNPNRYLIIPAYCTNPQQTLASSFVLPNDRVSGKLIVTFHYYDPHEFGIEGRRTAWGTPADRQKVDSDFAPFKARFIDNNIPVIIGECGAVLQLYPNDAARQAQARQSRFDYIPHVFATAKKYGLVPIYWDNGSIRGNGEKFGLFDRRTGQPNSADSTTLITMMINAVR